MFLDHDAYMNDVNVLIEIYSYELLLYCKSSLFLTRSKGDFEYFFSSAHDECKNHHVAKFSLFFVSESKSNTHQARCPNSSLRMMEDSDLKAGSQGRNKSQDLSGIGSKNHFFPALSRTLRLQGE
jgi:hypothetical protein